MIRLARLRLHRVTLSLKTAFRSAESTQRTKDTYLLGLEDSDGVVGWSEISAQNDPNYWPETVATCVEIIEHHLLERLTPSMASPGELNAALRTVKGNQMARASVEMAYFDLLARSMGISLWQLLGAAPGRTHVPAGVSLSLADDATQLAKDLGTMRRAGYRFAKIKIAPTSLEPLVALARTPGLLADTQPRPRHESLSPESPSPGSSGQPTQVHDHTLALENLVLDANGSFDVSDLDAIDTIDALGFALLEQPLFERDLVGNADLARRLRTPIGLDESIGGVEDVITALRLGMRPTINLKPSRVGGYVESLKIIECCEREGLHLRIGGMLETGIGRAHNLALASHPAFDRVGDLGASDHYFDTDVTEPFGLEPDGTIERPSAIGLGRVPDPALLTQTPYLEFRIH
jgi:O-succinylbenzoate synthase